ncbi:MAG: 2-oxoglutarate dehydrogenase E1 subunit family protein, partial [Acidimicrobiales bacterium]
MSANPQGSAAFGPNAWLVDDMYEQYRRDPASVSESWQEFFDNYRPGGANLARHSAPEVSLPAGDDEVGDYQGDGAG